MLRFRTVELIAERFGLLRHVMRYLQWDHGIQATDLLDRILSAVDSGDDRHPDLLWTFSYFDLFQTVPSGWRAFYRDLERFIADAYGIVDDPALQTVLEVQRALMPSHGRSLPEGIPLAHDYVAYYLGATEELYRSGHAGRPTQRLADHRPGTLHVTADPLDLCRTGVRIDGDPRDDLFENDFAIGANSAFELASPLMRLVPHVAFAAREAYDAVVPRRVGIEPEPEPEPPAGRTGLLRLRRAVRS